MANTQQPPMEGDDQQNTGSNFGGFTGSNINNQQSIGTSSGTIAGTVINDENHTSEVIEKQQFFDDVDINDLILPYDNPLFGYNNYTWNFTLFTVHPSLYDAYLMNPYDTPVEKFVIARSGVTGRYSLDTVNILTVPPASPGMTSNFTTVNGSIEIKENGGMRFTDDVIQLSYHLGYNQFGNIPFILELEFVGFDGDTGEPKVIPDVHKIWGINIYSVRSTASRTGGTMTHILNFTTSLSIIDSKDWVIGQQYTMTAGGDLLSGLTQLESFLNARVNYENSYYKDLFGLDKLYEIKCSANFANAILTPPSSQSASTSNKSNGSKDYSFEASTPISKVIDGLMDMVTDPNSPLSSKRQFVNIIPRTQYVGYDDLKMINVFKYTFYICDYSVGDVLTADDINSSGFNLKYFLDNIQKYKLPDSEEERIQMKRYDYQFTGLNNEILELDINFDTQYAVAVAKHVESLYDATNSKGTHVPQKQASRQPTSSMGSKTTGVIGGATAGGATGTAGVGIVNSNINNTAPPIDEEEQQSNNTTGNVSEPENTEISVVYVEDFRERFNTEAQQYDAYGMKTIPLKYTSNNFSTPGFQPNPSSSGEIDRAMTRSNYYTNSFMVQLDMKVVGDPYWLGWNHYQIVERCEQLFETGEFELTLDDLKSANFLNSEAYLVLNLQPPAALDEKTGLVGYKTPVVFSQAVYRVVNVKSTFSSRGFVQQIKGALIKRSLRRLTTESKEEDE